MNIKPVKKQPNASEKFETIRFNKTHTQTALIIKTVLITVIVFYLGYRMSKGSLTLPTGKKEITKKSVAVSPAVQPGVESPSGSQEGDENLDTDVAYQQAMANPTYIPPYGWKKYITKDQKYSLYYPSDWMLDDQSKDVDLYNDGKIQFRHDISISKGTYVFKSYNPLAWGPGICMYPDSPPFDGPGGGDITENYVEVKGNDGTYRRPEQSTYQVPPSKLRWFICKKEDNNAFTSVSVFGSTWYDTPPSYDKNMLIIMDQILESIKKL